MEIFWDAIVEAGQLLFSMDESVFQVDPSLPAVSLAPPCSSAS